MFKYSAMLVAAEAVRLKAHGPAASLNVAGARKANQAASQLAQIM